MPILGGMSDCAGPGALDGVMEMSKQVLRIAILAAVLAACSEAGPTTPDPDGGDGGNGGSPAISISLSATTLSLPQGGSGEIVIALSRTGGFAGEVSLGLEGAPTGVTPTFAPAVVSAGGSAAALTLAIGGSVSPGTHALTVRASGVGVDPKTATLSLTVTAVTTPGFTLTVANPNITIAQGSSMATAVSIARLGGFNGTVNLSVTGAPAGVNANLSPAFILADPATLTIGATFNAPLGVHTLTVTATNANVPQQTATVTVEVTPSNPVGEVAWQFCPASGLPVWFAYQDGLAGPWIRVTGINDIFAFDMTAARGGVAYARQTASGGYRIDVQYGSTEELNTLGQRLCAGSRQGRTLYGSVTGLAAGEQAWIGFGDASAVVPSTSSSFSLGNVLGGTFDLLASAISNPGGASNLDALILRRGLNPADGSTLAPLDFAGSEAFAPIGGSVTIGDLGTDQAWLSMAYHSGGRRSLPYWTDATPVASSVRVFPAIPASRQLTGDLHVLTVMAAAPGAPAGAPGRTATVLFGSATSVNAALGPALSAVTVTVPSASPYARLQASYPVQAAYASYWTLRYSQAGTGGTDREVVITATGSWLTTASTVVLGLPDFAGTGGWDFQYAPRTGVATGWTFSAAGWIQAGGLDGPPLIDGTQGQAAMRSGTITP